MAVLNFYHIGKLIPAGAEYIGRPMAKLGLKGSIFANPFKLEKGAPRQPVIDQYRVWLWDQIRSGKITIEDLLALEDKDLVCFCHPQPCHGDVVEAAIKWARSVTNNQEGESA